MIRVLFALLCFASPLVQAALTPLPGSTPQQALAGDVFPNPIRLLVTDAAGNAVPGARVAWTFPPSGYSPFWIDEPGTCIRPPFDSSYRCGVTADAQGIAQIRGLYAVSAGSYALSVVAGSGATVFLGSAKLEFRADPRVPPIQLLPVSGDGLSAVIGSVTENGFVVRVLTAQGQPIPSAIVEFSPRGNSQAERGFLVDSQPWSVTDNDGHAASPPLFAGWVPGVHTVQAMAYDRDARAAVSASFSVTITNARGELDVDLTNMWWAGPVENGWGMSVVKHGDQAFNVLFVYDSEGKPTWYVQPGGVWIDSNGWSFAGPLYSPRSSPWFAYDTSRFVVGPRIGYMNTSFFGPTRARFGFSLDGPPYSSVLKNIVTQDFTGTTPSPLQGVADMWWGGPEQNGWGVAILEQFGGLFAVWFTYDAEGKPTWFVMPGGEWLDATTYSGTMYRTSGSPWVGRPYDVTKLQVGAVGPYILRFSGTENATLEVNVDGVPRVLPITRQPF